MLTEDCIRYAILAFSWLEFLWELALSLRQHRIYSTKKTVPEEIKEIMDTQTYEKARVYGLEKGIFSTAKEFYSLSIATALIVFDGLNFFRITSGSLAEAFGCRGNEPMTGAAFMFLLNSFNTVTSLPFSIYYHFVLEEKHGFNKQTAIFYAKDQIKGFLISQLISVPLVSVLDLIGQVGGDYFFIYQWLFVTLAVFFLLTVYPDYIAPLFDKYTPPPDGELKTRFEQLAAGVRFPLHKLYVVEASKRSLHSNAYFYGFFKSEWIVLFDTLLKDCDAVADDTTATGEKRGCDNEEVLAVVGHELGHWKLKHVLKNIVIVQIDLLVLSMYFGFSFKYRDLGFYNEQPVIVGLLVALVCAFYKAALRFDTTLLSRRFELQADAFAKSLGKSLYLRRALIKINRDNLGFPFYDWLYSTWHHSHPPLLERIEALDKSE